MSRLWAPWRMQYIDCIDKNCECFICDILNAPLDQDAEHLVVSRHRRCFVILNRFPYNNGHLLVCPNSHKSCLNELEADELLELMQVTSSTVDLLKRVMHPHGFNIGINLGRVAGAGVPGHLHMHIVPRWEGDTNFMPVLADIKVIPQALEDLRQQLVRAAAEAERASQDSQA